MKARAVERQRIALKQAELDALLDVPLTSMGFSGKYPTKTGKLEMPDQFSGERRWSIQGVPSARELVWLTRILSMLLFA